MVVWGLDAFRVVCCCCQLRLVLHERGVARGHPRTHHLTMNMLLESALVQARATDHSLTTSSSSQRQPQAKGKGPTVDMSMLTMPRPSAGLPLLSAKLRLGASSNNGSCWTKLLVSRPKLFQFANEQ
jgi:hypothetical protein